MDTDLVAVDFSEIEVRVLARAFPPRTLSRCTCTLMVNGVHAHDARQLHEHLLARGFPGPECPRSRATDTDYDVLRATNAWLWSRLGAVCEARQPAFVLAGDAMGDPQVIADRVDAWLAS